MDKPLKLLTFSALCILLIASCSHAYHFEYKPDGNVFPEIMLDADFTIRLRAHQGDRVVAEHIINVNDAANSKINASKDLDSLMEIQFQDSVKWEFLLKEEMGKVTIKRAITFIPHKVFPELDTYNWKMRFEVPSLVQAGMWTQSYQCKDLREYLYRRKYDSNDVYTFSVFSTEKAFRIQAYALVDGVYGDPFHCEGDHYPTTTTTTRRPTTKRPTTRRPNTKRPTRGPATTPRTKRTTKRTTRWRPKKPTTKPTTTTVAPGFHPTFDSHRFIVKDRNDGHTCIVLEGTVKFSVNYKVNIDDYHTEVRTVFLGIPDVYTAGGECGDAQQRLSVKFYDDWYLTFVFQKAYSSGVIMQEWRDRVRRSPDESDELTYRIANISLSYMNDKHTPGFAPSWKQRSMASVPSHYGMKLPEKVRGKSFFQCKDGMQVTLGPTSTLDLSDVKFKAFMNPGESDSFNGDASSCVADKKDEAKSNIDWSLVGYIMLGIFLLAAVVILAAFLYRRNKKKRKGYRSIAGNDTK